MKSATLVTIIISLYANGQYCYWWKKYGGNRIAFLNSPYDGQELGAQLSEDCDPGAGIIQGCYNRVPNQINQGGYPSQPQVYDDCNPGAGIVHGCHNHVQEPSTSNYRPSQPGSNSASSYPSQSQVYDDCNPGAGIVHGCHNYVPEYFQTLRYRG
jgi:hypothetical protein